MYKERKEITHGEISEKKKNIYHYIRNIRTMYVNNGHKTHVQEINVSKVDRKEKDS